MRSLFNRVICTLQRSNAASNCALNFQGPVVASKVGAKRAKTAVAEKKASPASKPKTKDLSKDAASATENLNEDGSRTSVWLMKSEPDTFSVDDLIKSKDSTSHWDGVVSGRVGQH